MGLIKIVYLIKSDKGEACLFIESLIKKRNTQHVCCGNKSIYLDRFIKEEERK